MFLAQRGRMPLWTRGSATDGADARPRRRSVMLVMHVIFMDILTSRSSWLCGNGGPEMSAFDPCLIVKGCDGVAANILNCRISRGRHLGRRQRPGIRNGIRLRDDQGGCQGP